MRRLLVCLALALAGCGEESAEDWTWAEAPPRCPSDEIACAERDAAPGEAEIEVAAPAPRVPAWKSKDGVAR